MKRLSNALMLLALASPVVHAADSLGRLFFTPAQRNTLDAGKQLARPKQTGPAVQGPKSLTVNGIVTRSDGESTVWVNGGAAGIQRRGSAPISAKPAGAATARVQTEGTNTRLRVGQTLDRTTGKVREAYEGRSRSSDPVIPLPDPAAPATQESGEPGNTASASDQNGGPAAR